MRLRGKRGAIDDNAGVTREPDDVITARLISLGSVMESSAFMEYTLRNAFCSLVGSKYAAIVAGGQPVSWLIEQCRALTDAHRAMPRQHREAIKAALERCRAANERRNHLVHGVKTASRAGGSAPGTVKSRSGTRTPAVQTWTPDTIREAARELLQADLALSGAMENAVSPKLMVIGDAFGPEEQRRPW
jgi:hypothetical protein